MDVYYRANAAADGLPSSSLRPTTLYGDEKLCLANVVEQYRLELQHQAVPNTK